MNLKDEYINFQIGKATLPKPNCPISTVLSFLESNIPEFANQNKNSGIKNEKGLTQRLVRLLNVNLSDNFPFFFEKEGMEDETSGNSPSVDIDVVAKEEISVKLRIFEKQERFFAFEAKVLGVKESYRQKEYIKGFDSKGNPKNCGGIERFKNGAHGKNIQSAGMIGFILKENQTYWFNRINLWIDEFALEEESIWDLGDKLQFNVDFETYSTYYSKHRRKGSNFKIINIFHYWINLN